MLAEYRYQFPAVRIGVTCTHAALGSYSARTLAANFLNSSTRLQHQMVYPQLLGQSAQRGLRKSKRKDQRSLRVRLLFSGKEIFHGNQKNNDQSVLSHINQLAKEKERLYAKTGLTDDDHARLADVNVELDQSWDLLRQRRGKRR